MADRVNRTRVAMEDERIAHLKQRNEERLARFLDSKNRCIGIDQGAIQGQIDEKQRRAAAERVAESKYGASAGGVARAGGGGLVRSVVVMHAVYVRACGDHAHRLVAGWRLCSMCLGVSTLLNHGTLLWGCPPVTQRNIACFPLQGDVPLDTNFACPAASPPPPPSTCNTPLARLASLALPFLVRSVSQFALSSSEGATFSPNFPIALPTHALRIPPLPSSILYTRFDSLLLAPPVAGTYLSKHSHNPTLTLVSLVPLNLTPSPLSLPTLAPHSLPPPLPAPPRPTPHSAPPRPLPQRTTRSTSRRCWPSSR